MITKGWRYSRQTFSFRILQPFVMDFVPHAARAREEGWVAGGTKVYMSLFGFESETFDEV